MAKSTFKIFPTLQAAVDHAERFKPEDFQVVVSEFAENVCRNVLDQSLVDFATWDKEGVTATYSKVKFPGVKQRGSITVALSPSLAEQAGVPTYSVGHQVSEDANDAHKTIGLVCRWAKANGKKLSILVNGEPGYGWYPLISQKIRLVVVNSLSLSVSVE